MDALGTFQVVMFAVGLVALFAALCFYRVERGAVNAAIQSALPTPALAAATAGAGGFAPPAEQPIPEASGPRGLSEAERDAVVARLMPDGLPRAGRDYARTLGYDVAAEDFNHRGPAFLVLTDPNVICYRRGPGWERALFEGIAVAAIGERPYTRADVEIVATRLAGWDDDEFPEPSPEMVKLAASYGLTAIAATRLPRRMPVQEFWNTRELLYRPSHPDALELVRVYLDGLHHPIDAERNHARVVLYAACSPGGRWYEGDDEEAPPESGRRPLRPRQHRDDAIEPDAS